MFVTPLSVRSRNWIERSGSNRAFIAPLLALAVLMLCAGAAQAQVMAVTPASLTVDCGETVFVDVTLDDVVDLQGFSLTFDIDPNIVTVTDVVAGEGLGDAACGNVFEWDLDGNLLTVDMAFLGCTLDLTDPRPIIRINFEAGADDGVIPLILSAGHVAHHATTSTLRSFSV